MLKDHTPWPGGIYPRKAVMTNKDQSVKYLITKWKGEKKKNNNTDHLNYAEKTLHEIQHPFVIRVLKKGAPGWLSLLSVWISISVQVMISWFVDRAPCPALCGQCGTCLGFSLSSLSLCPSPCARALSLKNKETFKKKFFKILNELGRQRNFLNTTKVICEKPIADIIFNDKKLNAFPPKTGRRQECLL